MQGVFQDPSNKIGTNQHFRLGTSMFMYILLLSKIHGSEQADKIIRYAMNKHDEINGKSLIDLLRETNPTNKISNVKIIKNLNEYSVKSNTAAFFIDIIRYCEIIIRKETESYYEMKLLDLLFGPESKTSFPA
jgi:hypothetical protein